MQEKEETMNTFLSILKNFPLKFHRTDKSFFKCNLLKISGFIMGGKEKGCPQTRCAWEEKQEF